MTQWPDGSSRRAAAIRHSTGARLPPERQAVRARCVHPSGTFVEFKKEEIEQSIPRRFETIAARYPDQPAVRSEKQTLSYRELNRRANRIGRAILASCGEGQEPVGVLLAEGAPVIAAILGALKAGKFFVPIDPSFPQARKGAIAADSEAVCIVTDDENLSSAAELYGQAGRVINVDELSDRFSGDDLELSVSPDALAYVIYTSGSTGEPKGIVQNHRNTLHVTMTYANAVHICRRDRLSLLFSASTSAGAYGIFRALLCGATLYPFPVRTEGVARLAGWLLRHKITVYSSVPTLFRRLCETLGAPAKSAHLRLIELLGEAVYKKDIDLYRNHFSARCFLANWLGSTEAGVVRCHVVDRQTAIGSDILPAGYAVPDREVLLLDEERREVGAGQIGEIAVKSRYLSPGYWRNPDRSRSAFFSSDEGDDRRIYLTGDMGRMLPDGCLLQLGRKDHQVKLRGQRVELVEIETALLRHPAISEAAVAAKEDSLGEKRLIAYVAPKQTDALRTNELRRFLERSLPEYMIPSLFVRLAALPLLPNGKVDRQALPAPNREEDDAARVFVAARSPLEETLAQTWAAVLGLERAGVHDNFFDLGGDSILAIQIAVKASRSGLRLTPKDIFEHQTVAELAAFAATASTVEPEREAAGGQAQSGSAPGGWRTARDIPIAKLDERELHRLIVKIGGLEAARRPLSVEEIEDVYAFSPAQRVMLLYSLSYPADCGVYHQQFCYRLRGDLDAALFERSWQRVVERHPVLRTAFRAEPLQVVKRHAAPPFDYRDWRELSQIEQEEELEEFLKTDRRRRFELSEPPLMRLALFRLSQDRYWFVWSSHHVIMDGWSASIVLREFLACYDALRRSEVPDLPPAPPFRDYIAWLQQQDRNEADAEGFWRELLKDFAAPTPLGLDAALRRSQAGKASYGERQMQLSAAETASLQDFARKHRVTLNTVTQTAWALVLSRYSGESDVLFGAVLSARPSAIPGVESMVGPLINTLPIRVRLSANDSVRTLLKERHRQQVEMSPYAYSSMLKVHDWSGVPRGTALFDSLFLFQSYPEPPVQGRDAALEVSLDRSVQRTNCPLNVAVWPGALLCISVNFAATRFEAATIARMLEDFKAVLQAMVADPQKPVGNLMDMGTGIFSWGAATPEQ